MKLWGAGPQGGLANRIRWLGGSLERGVLVQRVWRNNAARDQTGWYDDRHLLFLVVFSGVYYVFSGLSRFFVCFSLFLMALSGF